MKNPPSWVSRFNDCTPVAATMVGMATKKLNCAAILLCMPRARAIAMVSPERLSPGKSAAAWARPIRTATHRVIWAAPRQVVFTESDHQRIAPVISSRQATIQGVAKASVP